MERTHNAFHLLIARATRERVLIDAVERSRVLLFNWVFTLNEELSKFPDQWHAELAEVLVHGKPQEAAEAMRMHVRFRRGEVIARFRAMTEERTVEPRMVRGPQRGKLSGKVVSLL